MISEIPSQPTLADYLISGAGLLTEVSENHLITLNSPLESDQVSADTYIKLLIDSVDKTSYVKCQ